MDNKYLSLVKKAIAHDPKAFVELCELEAKYIVYYCRQNMKTEQDAEDAAQEAFIRMQKSIGQLKTPKAFTTWLNKLLVSTCADMRRKMMRHEGQIPIDDYAYTLAGDTLESLPQEYTEDAALRASVVEMVRELPGHYRQCVLLRYYQNLSYNEIAGVLDITPDAVKRNLIMAKKHLRVELESKMDGWEKAGTPMVAVAPALGDILNRSVDASVLPGVAQKCMEAAGVYTAFTGSGAAGAAAGGAGVTGAAAAAGLAGDSVLRGIVVTLATLGLTGTILISFVSSPVLATPPVATSPQTLSQSFVAAGYEDTASSLPEDAVYPIIPAPAQDTSTPGAGVSTNPPEAMASVRGAVYLKDNTGKALRAVPELAGKTVALRDAAGNLLAQTQVDAQGGFVFGGIPTAQTAGYEVALEQDETFVPAQDNPAGKRSFSMAPGEEKQIPLYVQVTATPKAALVLQGGTAGGGKLNPQKIIIQNNGPLPITQIWHILKADSGEQAVAGTGSVIEAELLLLEDGRYTLECTVTDEAGNQHTIKADFLILSGSVDPALFT